MILKNSRHIVLFDDTCVLCQRMVQFLIHYDKKDRFVFGSLQSSSGQEMKKQLNISEEYQKSVILVTGNQVFYKSGAVIKILVFLGGIFRGAGILYIFPVFFRNAVYDLVEKTRFSIFGKSKSCFIITEENKHKFLI